MFSFFSKNKPPKKNVIFLGDRNLELPPKHYGFHSFTWAIDDAKVLLEEVLKIPQDNTGIKPSLIGRIKNDETSKLFWQLIAINSAIYNAYPLLILDIPAPFLTEITEGLYDGVNGLSNENGPISQVERNGMKGLILKYYEAIVDDYINYVPSEKGVITPIGNGNNTFQVFSKYICYAYSSDTDVLEDYSLLEKMALQHLIGEYPTDLMLSIRDNLKIKFVSE